MGTRERVEQMAMTNKGPFLGWFLVGCIVGVDGIAVGREWAINVEREFTISVEGETTGKLREMVFFSSFFIVYYNKLCQRHEGITIYFLDFGWRLLILRFECIFHLINIFFVQK